MWNAIEQAMTSALGLGQESLSSLQMSLRTALVFAAALILIRVGEKRFLGKNTTFDVVLGVMFGSLLSRAINSTEHFFQFFVAALVFVALHWLLAALAFYSDWWGRFLKGNERLLVKDGEIQWAQMRKGHIGEGDLFSALRQNGGVSDLADVEAAHLERSGDISVLKKKDQGEQKDQPRVVEVTVQQGVQTIRIKFG